MDHADGIYLYLQGKQLLTDLLGTGDSFKLFPENVTQNTQRPYVVYTIENFEHELKLEGASAIAEMYINFDIYGDDASDRINIGDALRNVLHTRGNVVITDSSNNTARIEVCTIQRDFTDAKYPPDGTEESVFCRTMGFVFVVTEAVPTLP